MFVLSSEDLWLFGAVAMGRTPNDAIFKFPVMEAEIAMLHVSLTPE